MTIGEYIKARRKELGLSAEQVAEECGVNATTVYRWENGAIGDIPASKISLLAKILRISPLTILEDHVQVALPNPEKVRTIAVYDVISCGTGLFTDDEIIDFVSLPVSILPNKTAEYFAQYADGDSMINAGIKPGDLVVFKRQSTIENGEIGCFCIDENISTCKRFSKKGGSIFLLPANDDYQPIVIEPENHAFKVVGVKAVVIER